MHMTRIMYTTGDRPFELVDIYYRADKYHYSVNMTPRETRRPLDLDDRSGNVIVKLSGCLNLYYQF